MEKLKTGVLLFVVVALTLMMGVVGFGSPRGTVSPGEPVVATFEGGARMRLYDGVEVAVPPAACELELGERYTLVPRLEEDGTTVYVVACPPGEVSSMGAAP